MLKRKQWKNFTFALHQSRTSSGLRIHSLPLPSSSLAPLLTLSDFHSCATHLNCASCSEASAVCLIRSRGHFEIGACCESSEKEREGEKGCVGEKDARRALQVPLSSQIKAMSKKGKGEEFKWQMRLSLRSTTLFHLSPSLPLPLPPSTNLGKGKRATLKCLSNVNENVRLQEMPHAALSANGNLISMCNTLRWQMLEVHLPYLTISYLTLSLYPPLPSLELRLCALFENKRGHWLQFTEHDTQWQCHSALHKSRLPLPLTLPLPLSLPTSLRVFSASSRCHVA